MAIAVRVNVLSRRRATMTGGIADDQALCVLRGLGDAVTIG
jgi:hypothetical protein